MESWLDTRISKLSSFKSSPYLHGDSHTIDRELARLQAKKKLIGERRLGVDSSIVTPPLIKARSPRIEIEDTEPDSLEKLAADELKAQSTKQAKTKLEPKMIQNMNTKLLISNAKADLRSFIKNRDSVGSRNVSATKKRTIDLSESPYSNDFIVRLKANSRAVRDASHAYDKAQLIDQKKKWHDNGGGGTMIK